VRRAAAIALVLAGCYSPRPAPGLECTADGRCPAGQDCIDGICEGTPQPDAPENTSRSDAPPGAPDAAVQGRPDAPVGGTAGDVCRNAIPVTFPGAYPGTFAGASDDYDPPGGVCANTDGVEVIYRIQLADPTAIHVEVDTGDVTGKWYAHSTCPPTGSQACGGISPIGGGSGSVTYAAGTHYFIVERSAMSTGTSFTLLLQAP
jgi:hypothetical protein